MYVLSCHDELLKYIFGVYFFVLKPLRSIHYSLFINTVYIHSPLPDVYDNIWMGSVPSSDAWLWPLQWHHNECDGASKHRSLDCLHIRLFKCRSRKTSKLLVTDLCEGNSSVTGGFPHKGPVRRKMFPFDDVIVNRVFYVKWWRRWLNEQSGFVEVTTGIFRHLERAWGILMHIFQYPSFDSYAAQ